MLPETTLGMMIVYRGIVIALLAGNQISDLPREFGLLTIDPASGSFRADEAANGESVTCTSEALKALPAGTYNVKFTTFALGSTTGIQLNEGFWYLLVLPN